MKIEWVLLADGLGQDSRGAVTAIALNQNVVITSSLPAVAKRAVIAHLVEAPGVLKQGDKFNVTFQVVGPAGAIVGAQTAQLTIGKLPFPELPSTTDLPTELTLNITEYGVHRVEVKVSAADGVKAEGTVEIFVIKPSDDTVAAEL